MRLPLLMWIRRREDPTFYITEVRKATGYEQGHVTDELKRFVGLQMLTKLDRERKNDRQYFARNDKSPLWAFVDVAAVDLWPEPDPLNTRAVVPDGEPA